MKVEITTSHTRVSLVAVMACIVCTMMMMIGGGGSLWMVQAEKSTCALNAQYPTSYTHCAGITCGATSAMVFATPGEDVDTRITTRSVLSSSTSTTGSYITSNTRSVVEQTQATDLASGVLPLSVGCPCDPVRDVGARFTQCDNSTNTKAAFFFFKPPAVCTGYNLPAPVTGIPCDMICEEGTRLEMSSKTCLHCDPGSYAHSGELSLNTWIATGTDANVEKPILPPQMRTYCTNFAWAPTCSPWQPRGDYIDSGDNRNKPFSKNYLEYSAEISQTAVNKGLASISFEYQVDAEQYYDFLYFYMDGSSDYLVKADRQLSWKKVSFPITKAGFHTFQWLYSKDSSKDEGEDRAKIRNISIMGAVDKEVVTRCENCTKGTYSNGTHPCLPCPPGTYQNEEGMSSCKACPPGHTSFSGATECFMANVPCTKNDYSFRYGSICENNRRTIDYFWILPKVCNESRNDSEQLPPSSTALCSETIKCGLGMKKTIVGNSQTCTYCEPGFFNDHDNRNNNDTDIHARSIHHAETECEPCKSNEASRFKILHLYDVIGDVSTSYTSSCVGECLTNVGWRDLGSAGLDSGVGNGKSVTRLSFTNLPKVTLEEDITPSFSVRLFLSCPINSGSRVDFLVDGVARKSVQCSGCKKFEEDEYEVEEDWQTVDIPLTMTERKKDQLLFDINFVTLDAPTSLNESFTCNRAVVSKVSLSGVSGNVGGAVLCNTCAGGQYPKLDKCESCSAGYYSAPASANCSICDANQFSYASSDKCYNCGKGQTSSKGSSTCSWTNNEVCVSTNKLDSTSQRFEFQKLGALLGNTRFFTTSIMDAFFYFDVCKANNASQVGPRSSMTIGGGRPMLTMFDFDQATQLFAMMNSFSEQYAMADNCPPGSYACVKYRNGQVVDFGNSISMETIYDTSPNVNNVGISITVQNYQNVCFNNVTKKDGPAKITIVAMCTVDSSTESSLADNPRLRAVDDTGCNFRLDTLSIYGCPLCAESDFTRLEGECNKDTKTRPIRFTRKEGLQHKCARGPNDLTNDVKTETCEPLSIETPYWIIGTVLGVCLVILVGISIVAVFLFFKYRSISKKYDQLRDEETTTNQQL
ncbi:hypothetical protein FDP41_008030 [Naegleria fowleri]|uniref:Tyrosine-protein kinase ephrin type A/B receptor-like domain-containing protein n=1 Tax=Naegleria fowleri TaxID=5763 RepID=A0A6A5CFS9_NAEFO|nr:uncharacterized protein FDP41_008030 [Naegleria fowleri]KAF0984115.1 hypothetical protein FDP41_008030 [Naegleria fowleri]CAG4718899.1 unnamed protein product [Naegleria fowleri]